MADYVVCGKCMCGEIYSPKTIGVCCPKCGSIVSKDNGWVKVSARPVSIAKWYDPRTWGSVRWEQAPEPEE